MHKKTLTIAFGLGVLLYCGLLFAETTKPSADNQADSEKVYKSVGPGGETIYSDKPSPDSEEMTLPKNGTYKPVKPPTDFTPYRPERKKPSKSIANSVSITSPQDKQTIWSGTGELPVSVSLDKGLGPGQKLEYQIDSKTVLTGTQTSHTFQNIFRGEHVIVVRLVDPSGSTLASNPVTVYMRRPSVQHPFHPTNRPVPQPTAPN